MNQNTDTVIATVVCPDCDSMIDDTNKLIEDYYNPEDHGACQNCYDPTPWGYDYSPGFEMEHNHLVGSGCCKG